MHDGSLLQKELNTTEIAYRNFRIMFISPYLFLRMNKLFKNNHGNFRV